MKTVLSLIRAIQVTFFDHSLFLMMYLTHFAEVSMQSPPDLNFRIMVRF